MFKEYFKTPTFDFILRTFPDKIRDIKEDFEKVKDIGEGGMAKVGLYKDKRTGETVAIKFPQNTEDGNFEKYFCREVITMAITNSPLLISLYGFSTKPYAIIMRYIPNGSLESFISKNKANPTQKTIIAAGIAYALSRFHEFDLVYRDLKPENVLLDENYHPIICDFGISRDCGSELTKGDQEVKTKMIGTPAYMAPEILDDSVQCTYDKPVDVYSYAMLLYYMVEKRHPYSEFKIHQIFQKVFSEVKPEYLTENAGSIENIMTRAWDSDSQARPTFAEIVKLFETHQVMFPGTDVSKVDKFFHSISVSSEQIADDFITSQLKSEYKPSFLQNSVTAASFFEQIIKPDISLSTQNLILQIKLMSKEEASSYLQQIVKYLENHNDIDDYHLCIIYNSIYQILKNGDEYIQILRETSFSSFIRFDGDQSKNVAKKIASKLFIKSEAQQLLNNVNLDMLKELLSDKIKNKSDLEKVNDIAKGGQGVVERYKDPSTGEQIAVKTISTFNEKYFCNEVLILASIDNPFIVPFYGFHPEKPYQIMTKYIPNGSLTENIQKGKLNPTQLTIIAIGLSHCLARFHEKGFIHRDIKPDNVLLDENYYPILCDFGLARDYNSVMTANIGTFQYLSPEAITQNQFSEKSDVYAFGITLYKMLTNRIPFENYTIPKYFEAIQNNQHDIYDKSKAGTIAMVLEKCWDYDPDERPSFSQIYQVFESHKAMFEGTNVSQVDKFLEYINNSANKITQKLHSSMLGKKLNHNSTESSYHQIFAQIISDSPPLSPQGLNDIIKKIDLKTAKKVFKKLADYIGQTKNISESSLFSIYNAVFQIMMKGPNYSKALASTKFPARLSFEYESIIHFSYSIYISTMLDNPDKVNAKGIEYLVKTQIEKNPHLIAYIVSIYFKYIIDEEKEITTDDTSLFQTFASKVEPFIASKDVESFLRVLSYFYPYIIQNTSKSEVTKQYQTIQKSFDKIMENGDDISIHFAYHFSINMMPIGSPNELFTVSDTLLAKHSQDQLFPDVISYLVTYTNVSSNSLETIPFDFKQLVSFAPNHSPAFLLLQFLSENTKWAYQLINCDDVWKYNSSIPAEFYIKLIFSVSRSTYVNEKNEKINLKQELFSKDQTYFLLRSLAANSSDQVPVLDAICKIYSVLLKSEPNPSKPYFFTEKRVNDITKNHVLDKLSLLMKCQNNGTASSNPNMSNLFATLSGLLKYQLDFNLISKDKLSNQSYINTFIEKCISFMKPNQKDDYYDHLLSLVLILCNNGFRSKFAKNGIAIKLNEIFPSKPEKLKKLIDDILDKFE